MTRYSPAALVAVSLAVCMAAAGAAVAQNTVPAEGRGARHAKLDVNGDGAIDRKEAAAAPRLAEHFDRLDKNKDGRIDASERPQRGKHGKHGRRGQRGDMRQRMQALDADKDGAIDRKEAAAVPRLAEHFDRLDKNKDGRIDASERPQRGKHGQRGKRGQHGRRGDMQARMQALDTNQDGRFSRAELAGRARILQNFDAIDSNRDGQIAKEELRAFHQQQRAQHQGAQPKTP